MEKKHAEQPKEQLVGGLTEAQIDKLKKQYGRLTLVSTETPYDRLHFWFKKPDMKTMAAVTKMAQVDPLQSSLILFKNCLINQENVGYAEDVDVMMAVLPHLENMIEKRTAEVKNF